jgi:hypothetical protein
VNKTGFVELSSLTPGAPPGGSDISPGSFLSGFLFQFDIRICPVPFTATFVNPANPEDPLIFPGTSEPVGYRLFSPLITA